MARGDQLIRQWSILHRIKQGRCTRRELAQEFDVSLKTILRDVDALSLFPIVETHEGIDVFYELMEGSRAPGLWFAPEELISLVFAGDLVLKTLKKTPFHDAFASILNKVKTAQKGRSFRRLNRFPEVFQVFSSSQRHNRRIQESMLQELIDAALETRCVWMKYFTSSRQVLTERVIEPFVIYQTPHGLRLIAYCHKREDTIFFNVNQIQELKVLSERFDLEKRRFDLETFISTSFDDMRCEPVVDVLLHIRYPTAYWAQDRNFHPSQKVEKVDDGVLVSFRSGGMPAIAACVMGVGTDCVVLEPPELREMVAKKAQAIANHYK